ncbi:hypothetical protein [Frigoribacterium faeni]|uniref:Uncharacterized protein n=1 Tax=Frigoribacterium faeni TaxID=145483 RepID=A0A7W3JIE6_9MICO|nr:hypothetical protein [Frigoribacterium faeni]MBA8813370.1 hypothetical protein [Frigoribacterium faeni]BFF14598.1 hypothetical protein GCM10025699_59010 [Microbacterium flavescens]GEK83114.1 hypothetical protein FFA01_14230 [Frigoribacterium faeni]
MQWWNSLVEWISSDDGWRIVSGAIIPFVSIVVAGVIAALIGRAAIRRAITLHDDDAKAAAVAGIVTAARKAAIWSSLGPEERAYSDHLAHESEVRLRLLPVSGARSAASWAEHELVDIKRNSATFSFQAEQSLADFRDRLVEWQARPKKAKKLFRYDLERWKYEETDVDKNLDARQRAWDAEQAATAASDSRPAPMPTPATIPSSAPTAAFVSSTAPGAAEQTTVSVPAAAAAYARPPIVAQPSPVVAAASGTGSRPEATSAPATVADGESGPGAETESAHGGAAEPIAPAVEQPAAAPAPAAEAGRPADAESDLDPDEARYGEPVSAHQVRRRTSPDPRDD